MKLREQDAIALDQRLDEICEEVADIYNMGGLSSGLYADFAKDVARQFAQELDEGTSTDIVDRLDALVADAAREGLKVEVWLESQKPLAMGNHVMRTSVRPARYPVVETHTAAPVLSARDRFEEWFTGYDLTKSDSGAYVNPVTANLWLGYRAAVAQGDAK